MARTERNKSEESEFSTFANVLVLIGVFVFLIFYSPLNSFNGFAVHTQPKTVTYNTQNIPLEGMPETGCYDSDAPSGVELLKTQIYTAGLVDSNGIPHYDACDPASENRVQENVCSKTTSGDQREERLVECPEGMMCTQGKCA